MKNQKNCCVRNRNVHSGIHRRWTPEQLQHEPKLSKTTENIKCNAQLQAVDFMLTFIVDVMFVVSRTLRTHKFKLCNCVHNFLSQLHGCVQFGLQLAFTLICTEQQMLPLCGAAGISLYKIQEAIQAVPSTLVSNYNISEHYTIQEFYSQTDCEKPVS